jgi:hypothetical protein
VAPRWTSCPARRPAYRCPRGHRTCRYSLKRFIVAEFCILNIVISISALSQIPRTCWSDS